VDVDLRPRASKHLPGQGRKQLEEYSVALERQQITNALDGTLAVLLGVALARRDLPAEFVHDPWRHALGTLARDNMAVAIAATPGVFAQRFRLHERLSLFPGEPVHVDHVFPVNAWKAPLLTRATDEHWAYDFRSLESLRRFVLDHYVTAEIPVRLHDILDRSRMPRGWTYAGEPSMWARYKSPEVTALCGRELRVPGEADPDFVRVE
jgi:hypothetical protein